MYVSANSMRLFRGRSTPAIRAMCLSCLCLLFVRALALALLVPEVLADHPHDAPPADDLALLADFLDRGSDLHRSTSPFPEQWPQESLLYRRFPACASRKFSAPRLTPAYLR